MQDYSELWERYKRFAAGQALKYLPNIKGFTIDDLLQESFIVLIDAADTFREDKGMNFLGWYKFYLRNRFSALGQWDKKYPDPSLKAVSLDAPIREDEDSNTLGDILEAPGEALDEMMSDCESQEAVRDAIERLDELQKEIIHRRYWERLSVKDTAAALGVTAADVRREHDHALTALRSDRRLRNLEDVNLYSGVGLRAFQERGSQVERIALHE